VEYRAIVRSELKNKILLSLLVGGRKISELKQEIDSSETTILHTLKEFESLNLTTKTAGVYSLTPLGQIQAHVCNSCYRTTSVMEKFKTFWLTHDVSPIPANLLENLSSLLEATLVETKSSELGKVHETFVKMLTSTRSMIGTSPIFHPDFVSACKVVLNQGGNIKLIITNEVLGKTLEATLSSQDGEMFQKFLNEGQLKIYINDNLKIGLTVTDNLFSLGLFDLNGQYDYTVDLISTHVNAIRWGQEVFNHYLNKSKAITL
jgi:predicted transcriptional regulator